MRPHPVHSPTRTRRLNLLLNLTCLALVLLAAGDARALPRYTARYGQSCTLCHTNPTGGGMRNAYAGQYLVPMEMAAQPASDQVSQTFTPQLTPNIAVGVDLRTLVYQEEEGSGSTLAMQGDMYLEMLLSEEMAVFVEQGLDGSGEVFGVMRNRWLDSYLKAGRFTPDFGWQFADHQMFNRRYLLDAQGTSNPAALFRSGLELGISPGATTLTASVLGRSEGQGDSYAARAQHLRALGPVNVGIGASVLRQQTPAGHDRAAGGFWYLAAGPVAWLGEVDETRHDGRLGLLVAQELTMTVRQGLDLRAVYNHQDPDRARRDGTRQKYGAGVAYMPRPYFTLLAMANYWKTDPGPLISDAGRHEGQLVIHFFY